MRKSDKLIIALVISFLVAGCIDSYFANEIGVTIISYYAHLIVIMSLSLMWLYAHSSENNVTVNRAYSIGIVMITALTIPIYFFNKFGFKQGSIKTGKGFILLVISAILYMLPALVFNNEIV